MSYAKELRQQMGRVSSDMRALIDGAKAQKRGLTSDERIKWNKMVAEYDSLEASVAAEEKTDDIVDRLSRVSDNGVVDPAALHRATEFARDTMRLLPREQREREKAKDPYARAFSSYLRDGLDRLDAQQQELMRAGFRQNSGGRAGFQNTMSTTTGSQGGYTVPQGFSGMLEEAKKWFGGIEGTVDRVRTETGNPLPWPVIDDTSEEGEIIGQNVQVGSADFAFNQVTLNAYIGSSKLVVVPLALIEDSYFDFDALVARLLGVRLGRLYNKKCSIGTGTNEPMGIIPATVAAGNVLTLGTGNTTTIAYNNLVDLEHLVDPAYRYDSSARFMFSDSVLKALKKLVDSSNRPLWQPGLTASFASGVAVVEGSPQPTILGHPYIVNNHMASLAADAYSMLFGALNCFKVREVAGGTTILRLVERYADYLQVGYIAFQRFDSNLIDAGTHPIAVMRQSHT